MVEGGDAKSFKQRHPDFRKYFDSQLIESLLHRGPSCLIRKDRRKVPWEDPCHLWEGRQEQNDSVDGQNKVSDQLSTHLDRTSLFGRFLIPNDFTALQFMQIVRKRIELQPKEALYLMINGKKVLAGDRMMQDVYNKCKDQDGFLYITYIEEITWGWRDCRTYFN